MSVIYIVFAILIFGFLIAIHEFGHFAAAKLCHVKVNEFSIGMGPTVLQKTKGETTYSIRALPCGGFCAMEGEDEDSNDENALSQKGFWCKFFIFVAGAFMNLVAGFLIVFLLYCNSSALFQPIITGFAEGNSLQHHGLEVGDKILAINGERVYVYSDVSLLLSLNDDDIFDLKILREGNKISLENFKMSKREFLDQSGNTYTGYGLYFGAQKANIKDRIEYSFNQVIDFIRTVRLSIQMLIKGNVGVSDFSGPVGIVSTMTEVGKESSTLVDAVLNILYFGALISVNLFVMNLLPIPALDGGKIFFLLINAITVLFFKKQIPTKYENFIHAIGFVLLLIFMAAITFQDIWKLFT